MAVAAEGLVEASCLRDVMMASCSPRALETEGETRRKGPVARRLVLDQRSSHVGLCVWVVGGVYETRACSVELGNGKQSPDHQKHQASNMAFRFGRESSTKSS